MKRQRWTWCAPLALSFFFASAHDACADETVVRCPAIGASNTLAAQDGRSRFAFVRAEMRDQADRAVRWSTAWSFFGTAVGGESIALAASSSREKDKIIFLASGLPAFGFPGLILIDPLKVMADDREVEAIAEKRAVSDANFCDDLARAERLFARDAADESQKTGIFSHALGLAANIASTTVIVLGTGDWGAALLHGVSGVVTSEINLWTAPTGAVSALERYRAGDLTAHGVRAIGARGLSFSLSW